MRLLAGEGPAQVGAMFRVVARGLAAIAFGVTLVACASPHAHDMLLPYATPAAASAVAGTHEIFVATTRARAKNTAQVFDGSRSEALNLARITVSVPTIHQLGKIERPKGRTASPAKYFTATDLVSYADQQAFVTAIRGEIARNGGHVLIFVHGYNNLFDDA